MNAVTLYKNNKPIKVLSDFIRTGDTQRTNGSIGLHSRVFSHDAATLSAGAGGGMGTQNATIVTQNSN